ncbi:ribosome maturation factor RimP [Candidatus Endoriftia persephone]|jgi:ribosome maturation factor RimP|uniref:Ribosome maturation factor RimP n=3 Tax=Gammaproteobacteria TaxID=1236 RepID=G2FGA7_9GAMM|nr:ribosome maturation factor RimP [Candidatus Endoriftia persephone]EGV50498.1 ribosome maturation factor rimP [endosymbiont of Riftia pachyptila (vent Ph05)]EGW54180.1 ribosome maturation factor RimP [endosymbiont of Tevnia jerichonana (vent Tica)]USF88605.1 ribosome maturation factor RimP [Candidatus Endoriftia persephone]
MRSAPDKLIQLIRQEVDLLGYELVGVESTSGPRGNLLLRIYIDHEQGINVDDCAQVSHQVSGVLDVEDPIKEKYDLEVSSPGLDRPLFEAADFERFKGQRVRVKTRMKIGNQRRFSGTLCGLEGNTILLEEDGKQHAIPLDEIDSARLIPEF